MPRRGGRAITLKRNTRHQAAAAEKDNEEETNPGEDANSEVALPTVSRRSSSRRVAAVAPKVLNDEEEKSDNGKSVEDESSSSSVNCHNTGEKNENETLPAKDATLKDVVPTTYRGNRSKRAAAVAPVSQVEESDSKECVNNESSTSPLRSTRNTRGCNSKSSPVTITPTKRSVRASRNLGKAESSDNTVASEANKTENRKGKAQIGMDTVGGSKDESIKKTIGIAKELTEEPLEHILGVTEEAKIETFFVKDDPVKEDAGFNEASVKTTMFVEEECMGESEHVTNETKDETIDVTEKEIEESMTKIEHITENTLKEKESMEENISHKEIISGNDGTYEEDSIKESITGEVAPKSDFDEENEKSQSIKDKNEFSEAVETEDTSECDQGKEAQFAKRICIKINISKDKLKKQQRNENESINAEVNKTKGKLSNSNQGKEEEKSDTNENIEKLNDDSILNPDQDGNESDVSSLDANELLILADDDYLSLFDNEEEARPDYGMKKTKKVVSENKTKMECNNTTKNSAVDDTERKSSFQDDKNKKSDKKNSHSHSRNDVDKQSSSQKNSERKQRGSYERDRSKRIPVVVEKDRKTRWDRNITRSPERDVKRKEHLDSKARSQMRDNRDKRSSSLNDKNKKTNLSNIQPVMKDADQTQNMQIQLDAVFQNKNKFQTIVLLANTTYEKTLKRFEGPCVKLVLNSNLNAWSLVDIVRQHKKRMGKNVLWLLISGVFAIAETVPYRACSKCKTPLEFIQPFSDYSRSKGEIKAEIKSLLVSVNKLCIDIQEELGDDGVIAMAPLLPLTVIHEDRYDSNHKKMHEIADLNNACVGKHASLMRLNLVYNIFCEDWIDMTCERVKYWMGCKILQDFKENNKLQNMVSILDNGDYSYATKLWTDTLQAFFTSALLLPFPDMIVLDPLNMYAKNENKDDDDENDAFDHVCVLGSTVFTKELQESTKGLPIYFLDENIDFDEDGVKYLNEQQLKMPTNTLWVILAGVSEVAELYSNGPLGCVKASCKEPVPTFVTKHHPLGDPDYKGLSTGSLVNTVIEQAFDFAKAASEDLGEGSAIFFAPVLPLKAIWAGDSSPHSHAAMHRMYKCDPSIPFFMGTARKWIDCAKYFEVKWIEKILASIPENSTPYNLVMDYIKNKGSVLEYVDDIYGLNQEEQRHCWTVLMTGLLKHFLRSKAQPQDILPNMDSQTQLHQPTSSIMPVTVPPVVQSPLPPVLMQPFLQAASVQSVLQPLPIQTAVEHLTPVPLPLNNMPFSGFYEPPNPITSYSTGLPGVPDLANQGPRDLHAPPVPLQMDFLLPPGIDPAPTQDTTLVTGRLITPCTVQAPPMLNETMGGLLIVQNVDTDLNEFQTRTLLKAFGDLEDMKWPLTQMDNPAGFIMFRFKSKSQTERALRILNYLRVFGPRSEVKHIGGIAKDSDSKLMSEDLEKLLCIQKVIEQFKIENKRKVPVTPVLENKRNFPVPPALENKRKVPVTPAPVSLSKPIHYNRKEESLPNIVKLSDVKFTHTVKVSNYSDLVPVSSFITMFKELGATGDVEKNALSDSLHVTFEGFPGDIKLLDGYRFPDKKLKITVDGLYKDTFLTKNDVMDAKNKIYVAASKVWNEMIKCLKEEVNSEVNMYSFKTFICTSGSKCSNSSLCHGYHDEYDRRRCTMLYQYSNESCSSMETTGTCPIGDKCTKAHTVMESSFHSKSYRSHVCPGVIRTGQCDTTGMICAALHPDTPEMFYNERWENLYVEGLGKTLVYLAAAIRNLYLLPNLRCLRVLCITPTSEMAKFYVECISDLAFSCNLKVAELQGKKSIKNAKVVIGTVDKVLTYLPGQNVLDCSRLKAVIFDDGPAIFEAVPKSKEHVFNALKMKEDLNIVVTTEKITGRSLPDYLDHLSVSNKFKRVYKTANQMEEKKFKSFEIRKKPLPTRKTENVKDVSSTSDSYSSAWKENRKRKQSEYDRTSNISTQEFKRRDQEKDVPSSKEEERLLQVFEELKLEYDRELKLYINMPEVHPEYEEKYGIFMEQYRKEYPGKYDLEHADQLWKSFWNEMLPKTLKTELAKKVNALREEGKKKTGQDLDFLNIEQLNLEKESSSASLKRKSPEDEPYYQKAKLLKGSASNPLQEIYFQKDQTHEGNPAYAVQESNYHQEKLYKGNPPDPIEDSMYQAHSQMQYEDYTSEGGTKSTPPSQDLTIEEILLLLEEVCPYLGVTEPALRLFVQKLRGCMSDHSQVCRMLENSDNEFVLKIVSEKSELLSTSSGFGEYASKLQQASVQALKLLEYPKTLIQQKKEHFGLNIEEIAKSTYNKDPTYIIQFIKKALHLENVYNATNDEITDIYVAVTSVHFSMACKESEKKMKVPEKEELGLEQFLYSTFDSNYQENQSSMSRGRNFSNNNDHDRRTVQNNPQSNFRNMQDSGSTSRGNTSKKQFQKGSMQNRQFQRGSMQNSQFQRGSTQNNQFQRDSTQNSQFQRDSMPKSQFQRGSNPKSQFQRGSMLKSQFQRGSMQKSQFQRGSRQNSQFQRGSRQNSQFQKGPVRNPQFQDDSMQNRMESSETNGGGGGFSITEFLSSI